MYMLTTENINGYYEHIDFHNKSVLTVTSSFDHALNAILLGARKVSTFDINKLSYYMANLKLATVKMLSYNEFIEFYFTNKGFNYELYKKSSIKLNDNVKYFFDKIYEHFNYDGQSIMKSFLFHHGHENKIEDNTYLLNNNYEKLKEKVENIEVEFINSSLVDLNDNIPSSKYDIILLSNISDYAKNLFGENYLEKYFDFVKKNTRMLLEENGIIAVAYIYGYDDKNDPRSDINIESKRKKVINDEYKRILFKSTIKKFKNDGIIILEGGMLNG